MNKLLPFSNESPRPLRGESSKLSEDHILSMLILRRARDGVLGANLFSDPAWDILLELHAAKLGGRDLSEVDIEKAICVSGSTTARWIDVLQQRGLLGTTGAFGSERLVHLTAEGEAKMERLANHWGSAFLRI